MALSRAETAVEKPLIVDLDGTLLGTDLLLESFLALLSSRPWRALGLLWSLRHGRAALKAAIAAEAPLDLATLPLNQPLLTWLRSEKQRHRRLYLATGADRNLADRLAARLGLFDGVIASDGRINLVGRHKADALARQFGPGGFDYAGNETADLPVWRAAAGVIAVNATPSLLRQLRREFANLQVITPQRTALLPYLRAMRPHQWLKNLLVLVPAGTAHQIHWSTLAPCLLAMVSFSLCASSVYLLNDLLDLPHDRRHPRKSRRPFAAGDVALAPAIPLLLAALLLAVAVGSLVSDRFLLVLTGYYLLTLAYSLFLKRHASLDVLALACLYGLRLVAGGAAARVPLSSWLLTFAIFLFLSLALVKRWTELDDHRNHQGGDPAGRGYRQSDLPLLQGMTIASGYAAVLVLGLYLNSPIVTALYHHPARLWAMPLILLSWLNRLLLLTHRGQMQDDPILFALQDRGSLACMLLVGADLAISL